MKCKRKIYLWADADHEIGFGHFVRSLSLANILKERFDCTFFTKTPSKYQRNEVEKVCKLVELPEGDERFDIFQSQLDGSEIVVLDNYFFRTDFQKEIKRKGCKIVSLDGMTDKHQVADIVICQQPNLTIGDFSVEPYTKVCIGIPYVLLRKEFYEAGTYQRKEPSPDGKDIVVAFGGADKYGITSKVAESLMKSPHVKNITAIVGDAYDGCTTIPGVKYMRNLGASEIVDLFLASDAAVLPTSTITKEALACRMPVIGGYFVDNQYETYLAYVRNGWVIGVGSFLDKKVLSRINEAIEKMADKPSKITEQVVDPNTPARYIELFNEL